MADAKKEHPDIANLKEREAMLVEKSKRIEGMDANVLLRDGRDINEMKSRNNSNLEAVRKEIARLSK